MGQDVMEFFAIARFSFSFIVVRAAVGLCFYASDLLLAAGDAAAKLPIYSVPHGLYGASRTTARAAGRLATRFRHATDRRWG